MWLPLWLNLAAVLSGLALGFASARRVMERHPGVGLSGLLSRAKWLYAVLVLVALLVGAAATLFVSEEAVWALPLWLQYYFSPALWAGLLFSVALLFAVAGTVALETGHPERWKLVAAGAVLVIALEIGQWTWTEPVASELRDRVEGGHVLQTHPASCACASGANIARELGIERSEREMAHLMRTSVMGTSAAQVVYGMRAAGIACEPWLDPGADPAALPLPAMLFVDHPAVGPEGHAVAMLAYEDGYALIVDPLIGRLQRTPDALQQVWHGRAVVCAQRAR